MPNGRINCFVDTNILLYLKDRVTTEKTQQATIWLEELARRGAIVISPQVVNEFCNVVRKKYHHVSEQELDAAVAAMRLWCTAETTYESAIGALALLRQMSVSYYDAVLLVSAMLAGCDIFLSEDLQHDRRIEGLRIINPFLASTEVLKTY